MQKEIFNYYPRGDKDPQTRDLRVDLLFEDGVWRKPGQKGCVSMNELAEMRENVERGWAQIIKKNTAGQIMPGEGEKIFLATVPPSDKKYKGRR